MAQAQARLKALSHTAVSAGKTILKAFSLIGIGLSLFAGFAAAGIFHKIFEGASDQAIEAGQRARQLSILLLQHNEIRQRGLGFAQRQVALIFEANEALAKQGALGKDVLDTASAQLSIYGYSPKKIAAMAGPMGDLLVTMRGVNATQEDSANLANAWGKAVRTGMLKPMQKFGFFMDKKKFAALSPTNRNKEIMNFARGFKGASAQGANTPEGRIQKLKDAMKDLSEQMGNELLPAQAEMASAWLKALPEIKPVMFGALKLLITGVKWLAGVVMNSLVPAWQNLQAYLGGPMANTWNSLKQSWNDMAGKVGPELMTILNQVTAGFAQNKSVGQVVTDIMTKLGGALKWVGDNASWLVPLVSSLTAAWYAASVAIGICNAVMAVSPIGWVYHRHRGAGCGNLVLAAEVRECDQRARRVLGVAPEDPCHRPSPDRDLGHHD